MPASAHATPAPFVVGVARSGTTLVRFMLDCHPQLAIPAETHFIPSLIQGSPIAPALQRDEFIRRVTSSFTWPDFRLSDETFTHALASVEPFTVADGLRVFYRQCAESQGKQRWGDKTPTYAEHIAAIARLLPEAHFVHVIRDGRAVAASRRHLAFGPGPDIAAQARDWRRKVEATRMQSAACPHYMEVRYEDLLARPEAVLRTICVDLELEYDATMLDFARAAETRLDEFQDWRLPTGAMFLTGDYRREIHQRARGPLDSSRVDHWRTALLPGEVSAFQEEAGELLAELGYV